jgi:beta-xylosidase
VRIVVLASWILALAVSAGAPGAVASAFTGPLAAQTAVKKYSNPVFKKDFPDPMVYRQSAHSFYAYGTVTGWEKGYFPILHSADLIHWKYVSDMFKLPPAFAQTDLWAPDVIKHGNTYYGYFTVMDNGTHCIGVSTASKPTGAFRARNVVACGDTTGSGYIDPDLFIDSDGKAYLYVSVDSPQHNISVIPMKRDLLHAAGPRKELFGLSQPWETGASFSTTEGPFMLHANKAYYLFYSGNDWNKNYSMGYATSSSPTGPFTKCSCNPILTADAKVHGPGGGSVVKGPDGKYWLVYHAWPGVEGYPQGVRNMRIDPLLWNGTTWSVHVTP